MTEHSPTTLLKDNDLVIYERRTYYGDSYEKIAELLGLTRQGVFARIGPITRLLKEHGIVWDSKKAATGKRAAKYDPAFLIEEIRRFVRMYGKRPTSFDLTKRREVREQGFPPLAAYVKAFGSLRAALESISDEIEVEPKPITPVTQLIYEKEDLLQCVRDVADALAARTGEPKRVPLLKEMKEAKQEYAERRERLIESKIAEKQRNGDTRPVEAIREDVLAHDRSIPISFPAIATFYKNFPGQWVGVVNALVEEGYAAEMTTFRRKKAVYTDEAIYEALYRLVMRRAKELKAEAVAANPALKRRPVETWAYWPSFAEASRSKIKPSAYTMRSRAQNHQWGNLITEARKYAKEKYGLEAKDNRRL